MPMRWRWPPENSRREPVVVLRVEADQLHQLLHAFRRARRRVARPWIVERVADDRADAAARVERAVRVLEDHLHAPPERAQLPAARPSRCRAPSNMTRPGGQRHGAASGTGRAWTCRSPSRPRGPASRRGGRPRLTPSTACTRSPRAPKRLPRLDGEVLARRARARRAARRTFAAVPSASSCAAVRHASRPTRARSPRRQTRSQRRHVVAGSGRSRRRSAAWNGHPAAARSGSAAGPRIGVSRAADPRRAAGSTRSSPRV